MYGFLIVVILVLIAAVYFSGAGRWQLVRGPDIHFWAVISDLPEPDKAAALISRVHSRAMAFLRYLRNKYCIDATDDDQKCRRGGSQQSQGQQSGVATGLAIEAARRRAIDALLDNYNFEVVYENDPRTSGTSYTLAKGNAMYLCVREKRAPYKFVDEDTLFFVVLHELAHIANYDDVGHTDKYWSAFKMILNEAHEGGFYTPINYASNPVVYCGLNITYNPYYDKGLAEYGAF